MYFRKFCRSVLLLAAVVLFCLLSAPTEAKAATTASGSCGGNITWTLDSSGTLTISGKGAMDDCEYAASPWYSYRSSVKKLVIESGITYIGEYCFYGCYMTSVSLPETLITIGWHAFYQCSKLTSVTIPDSVLHIKGYAFDGCSAATTVSLGSGVTKIENNVFDGMYALTGFTVSQNNLAYSSDSRGVLFNKDKTTLIQAPAKLSGAYTIPSTVTMVSWSSFRNCSSMTSVTIPGSVTTLGGNAFYSCTSLTSVTIPSSVTVIEASTFYQCTSLTSVSIPDTITYVDNTSFQGCSKLSYTTYGNCRYLGNSSNPYLVLMDTTSDTITYCTIHSRTRIIVRFAFSYCSSLTSLTIPSGVTTIEDYAFDDCSGLTSISIPDTVTSMGYSLFADCANLSYTTYNNAKYLGNASNPYVVLVSATNTSITDCTIHSKTKIIYRDAFSKCYSLTTIALPSGLTRIGGKAFYNCSKLTSVTLPEGLIHIGSNAFYNCSKLTSINIPSTVTAIEDSAFSSCSGLTAVHITDLAAWCRIDFEGYSSYGGNPLGYAKKLYLNGQQVTDLTIPSGITQVKDRTFVNCELNSVTIPSGVTSIGTYAFGYSTLKSITIPNSVTTIGDYAFYNCKELTSISISRYVTYIGTQALHGCTELSSIWVNSANTKYASDNQGALYNKAMTQLICVPQKFSGSFTVPASVITINDYAFSDNKTLTSVTMQEGVVMIGYGAFQNCTALESVAIPNTLTIISEAMFRQCSALTTVNIPDSVSKFGASAFAQCTSLTSIDLPQSISTIAYELFYYCTALTSVTIPDSVHTIMDRAFYECHALAYLSIPHTVKTIESSAFGGCSSLKSVTLPDGITQISDDLFCGCTSLTSVIIPESVTSIEWFAFASCENLTSVTIPLNTTTISTMAFEYCDKLENIYYSGTPTQWQQIQIDSYNEDLTAAYVHYNHTHDFSLFPAESTVTCEENGYIEHTCIYGETYREYLPAYGHDYSGTVTVVDPGCLTQGYTATACIRCDSALKSNYTDAVGHSMILLEAVAPTCTEPGLTAGSGCKRCGMPGVAQKEVAATGHNFENVPYQNVSATEHSRACTNEDCSYVETTAHQFGDWEHTDLVYRERSCPLCGAEESDYIDYTVTFQYADSTVIVQYTLHYGDAVPEPPIPDTPDAKYTFSGWDQEILSCTGNATYTARFETLRQPGDVDNIAGVTVEDVLHLLLHISMSDQFTVHGDADFDQNGDIDLNDAICLLLYVSMPEAFPL